MAKSCLLRIAQSRNLNEVFRALSRCTIIRQAHTPVHNHTDKVRDKKGRVRDMIGSSRDKTGLRLRRQELHLRADQSQS